MPEKKIFSYPDGHRMCTSGQRRAAYEAMQLILDPNSDDAQAILSRAVRGEYSQQHGASANKHDLISYVVFQQYNTDALGDYIEPNGQFTIQGKFGFKRDANIFQEVQRGKELY